MKLNNSIKLAIANFSLFWKLLLYKIIALGVGILFVLPTLGVLKQAFLSSGFSEAITQMFTAPAFQSITTIADNILAVFNSIFAGVSNLATSNVFVLIYLSIVIFIIVPFLLKLSDVPASECAYSYMSSLNKNSFTINYINMFGKSAGYSILRALFEVPLVFAIGAGVYGFLQLIEVSNAMAIIAPLLMFIYVVLMLALNSSIFNGWAPSIVVFNCCATKAFVKGAKAVKRNFFSVLSSFMVVACILACLFYLFGLYSFIVTIPFYALVVAVFGQVLYFESQGMDYYISPEKIIKPRKLECADNISKVKNII